MRKKIVTSIIMVFLLVISFGFGNITKGKELYIPDVESVRWAKDAIYFLYEKGIVKGVSAGYPYSEDAYPSFAPNNNITREQAALMLARELYPNESNSKKPTFLDLDKDSIYYDAISIVVEHGIFEGYSADVFKPHDPITRAETAKVLTLSYGLSGTDVSFTDINDAPWAVEYIKSLASNNVINGYNDLTFRPNQPITRAEFSLILARILDGRFRSDPAFASCGANWNEVVLFPDKYLVEAIKETLPSISGDITVSDMCGLSSLNLNGNDHTYNFEGKPIQDLTGMEYANYLSSLSIYKHPISDVSALEGLTELEHLYINTSMVSDISPLNGLTKLQNLSLFNSKISDISALHGLKNLEYLRIDNNSISDISALHGLENLEYLRMDNNLISDISVLNELPNLKKLFVDENDLSIESKKVLEELKEKGVNVNSNES